MSASLTVQVNSHRFEGTEASELSLGVPQDRVLSG
jgi:hypothetical protein